MLKDAGILNLKSSRACNDAFKSCLVCTETGSRAQHQNMSLTHVKSAFNEELHAEFVIVYVNGAKHEVPNISEMVKRYGDRTIATNRSTKVIQMIFERSWLYRHDAPTRFSADHEFCRPIMRKFLRPHRIETLARPSSFLHKNGRIEHNKWFLLN